MEIGIKSALDTSASESENLFQETPLLARSHRGSPGGLDAEDDDGGRCVTCDALWFNGNGYSRKYTDKSTGLTKWNHLGSGILSAFLLLSYLTLLLYDATFYSLLFWGKKKYVIIYTSYVSCLIFGGSVPVLCTIALINNAAFLRTPRFLQWPHALDIRYIVRRLQYLPLNNSGLPNKFFLIVCLGFPMFIAFYRLMFYVVLVESTFVQSYVSTLTSFCILTLYGIFCYLIYLMRISFSTQLKLDIDFIRRHINQLDVCRGKIAASVQDFKALRQLTNGWMVMILALLTWSIVTQVSWFYLFVSGVMENKTSSTHQMQRQNYIMGLTVMEKCLFFVFPCYAIGGFSMNETWLRFQYYLFELRSARYELFWYRLLQFINEQRPVEHATYVTLVFTLLGLFLGLQYGHQDVELWKNNVTESSGTTGIEGV